jgi:hypothetical protein
MFEIVVRNRATDRRIIKANYVRVSRRLESEEIKDLCTEEFGVKPSLICFVYWDVPTSNLDGARTVETDPPQTTEYTSKQVTIIFPHLPQFIIHVSSCLLALM